MLLECNYQSTKFLSQKEPEKQFDQNPTCIRTKKRKTKPTSLPENPPSTSEEASDAELSPSVAAEMPGVFCPRPSDNTHTHTQKHRIASFSAATAAAYSPCAKRTGRRVEGSLSSAQSQRRAAAAAAAAAHEILQLSVHAAAGCGRLFRIPELAAELAFLQSTRSRRERGEGRGARGLFARKGAKVDWVDKNKQSTKWLFVAPVVAGKAIMQCALLSSWLAAAAVTQ